ncbi:hypothetical protein EUX98_g2426 [Antrodiella citrinella]|uniref:Uncharacterized protein n=1 Tax=Antrodiella citrinella TaxID=2447956 RepID=A0A4S4N0F4_9APHY|nr:hypothetical protein EUX98_g2426 [Antrodiella citrinella]
MDVRQQLIQWIAEEALGGDAEAAEWDAEAFLDTITLPSSYHITIKRIDSLDISVHAITSFEPESIDEDLNAGTLQLPKGFLLLVTEHGVQEGKLLQRGIMNIRALQEVMSSQNLSYSFPFSRFSFPTDISCIVTTDGSKSAFFKTDITVDLHISTPSEDVSNLYKPRERLRMPSQEQLTAFRDLIAGARSGKVSVTETTSAYIQQDFVRDRQADKSITSEDLIRRMTVAKLYALSCHATELTIDMWERSKALDDRRKARLL